MSLAIASPDEFADRLIYVLGLAAVSARSLSLEMDKPEGYVSRWTNRKSDNAPKKLDPEVALEFAKRLAGCFQLIDDELKVFSYLIGIENDPRDIIRASISPVGPRRGGRATETHAHHAQLRGWDSNPQPTGYGSPRPLTPRPQPLRPPGRFVSKGPISRAA